MFMQFWNAYSPIDSTPSGIMISDADEQPSRTLEGMFTVPSANSTFFRLVQPAKTDDPDFASVAGITTEETPEQFEN